MTNDLISREAAKEAVKYIPWCDWAAVGRTLDELEAVDAAPVVHGNNVTPTHPSDMFVCSECGFVCEITKLVYEDEDYPEVGIPNAYEYDCKFCPNCGAKMDKGESDV